MSSIKIPSIEDKALAKVVINLWTNYEMIVNLLNNDSIPRQWPDVEKYLIENCHGLILTDVLKEQLHDLVRFIEFQIFALADYLTEKISLDKEALKWCLSKFSWQPEGLIDRKKTIEGIIEDPILSLLTRYRLACAFCLEEYILILWQKFPVEEKSRLLSTLNLSKEYLDSVSIWTLSNAGYGNILATKSEQQQYISVSVYTFLCSLHECVPEATMYYWKQILREETVDAIFKAFSLLDKLFRGVRDTVLSKGLGYEKEFLDEIAVFLFTNTDTEYLESLGDTIECYFFLVARGFLQWPVWFHFLNAFEILQPYFKGRVYFSIIWFIEHQIITFGYEDNDYLPVLKDVWTLSSEENKQSIYCFLPSLISSILLVENTEIVSLILNDLPPAVRDGFMFTENGLIECLKLASAGKFEIIELILNMCVPQEKLEYFQSLFDNQIHTRVPQNIEQKLLPERRRMFRNKNVEYFQSLFNNPIHTRIPQLIELNTGEINVDDASRLMYNYLTGINEKRASEKILLQNSSSLL